MKKILLLLLILPLYTLFGQSIVWEQNYGGSGRDLGYAMQCTSDGGFIMGGSSYSSNIDVSNNNGESDFWVVKTDAVGNIEWEENYGGPDWDFLFAIEETIDGGYILAGQTYTGSGDFSDFYEHTDYWAVKIDAQGTIEWEQNYGGSLYDYLGSVIQTSDGGYLFGGSSLSTDGDVSSNIGYIDCWLVKTDPNGNIEWEKSYGGTESDNIGFNAIQATSDGGYVIAATTGSSDGDVSQNNGARDMWVIKIDVNGNIEWEQTYGGMAGENIANVQQTNDGGYLIIGSLFPTFNTYFTLIIKTDSIGNIEYQQTYPIDCAGLLEQTADGGFIIGGDRVTDIIVNIGPDEIFTDYCIVKFDAMGNVQWEQTYGGSGKDALRAMHFTDDGHLMLAGSSDSANGDVSDNYGDFDYWLLKVAIEDCVVSLENKELERNGALCAAHSDIPNSSSVTYVWFDEHNNIAAEFIGNSYFSPASLGTYHVVVSNGLGVCQTLGPITITELNGCCELD